MSKKDEMMMMAKMKEKVASFAFLLSASFRPFTRKKDNWKSKCFLMELANNSLCLMLIPFCLHFISMKCTRFDDI